MVAKKIVVVVESIGKLIADTLQEHAEDLNMEDLVDNFSSEEFMSKLTALVSKAQSSRTTKLKDPNAPKKPLTSYFLFTREKREKVKSEYPDLKLGEISKMLTEKWRTLSDRKKQKYSEKAKALREEYDKAMESYERPSDEELAELPINKPKVRRSSSGKKPRKKKDPNAPKGAKNAYMFFSIDPKIIEEAKEQLDSDAPRKEIRSQIASLWKNDYADESSRKKWMKLAKKDKERHEKEMEEYKASKPIEDDPEANEEDGEDGCVYVPTRGKNKGNRCGKKIKGEGKYCSSHKKTAASRSNSKEVEQKMDDDEIFDDE